MTENPDIVITVEPRKAVGKEEVGRIRRAGKIPAVVYGGDKETVAITVERDDIVELFKKGSGENTIFLLKVKGTKQERRAMIKDIQRDPINREFMHIDFIRVTKGHKLTVNIPIELSGDCAGVRHGGRINFVSRDLQVEVLPREMFDKFELDITDLDIGDTVVVRDLEEKLPESAKFLEDPTRVVVLIEIPRVVEEEVEEAAEGAEELITDEQAEPEVLTGKGKDESEATE